MNTQCPIVISISRPLRQIFITCKSAKEKISLPVFLLLLTASLNASEVTGQPELTVKDLPLIQTDTRQMLNKGEYTLAVSKLRQWRTSNNVHIRKFAQEYLGVTLERARQVGQARIAYEAFLKEFPDTPEARRVHQRLAALKGALVTSKPASTLVDSSSSGKHAVTTWDIQGSLNVDYRMSQNTDNDGDTRQSLSLMGSDLDLRISRETENNDFSLRLSLGHYEDLLSAGRNNRDRISYLYADSNWGGRLKTRIGRQRSRGATLMGRFDGLHAAYQFEAGPGLSMLAGMPVMSSREALFADNRRFIGLSVDSRKLWDSFRLEVYGLHQTIEGQVDRQTLGAEARYFGEAFMVRSLVDYDLHFGELNAAFFNFSRVYSQQSSLNVSYNYRKTPILSTRNALIGQGLDSIDALQKLLLTDAEIEDLALDRSLESQFLNLGFSHRISSNIAVSGSIAWSSISEGVSSGGLDASPENDQVYTDLRVTLYDVLLDRHNLTLGIRYSDQERSQVSSVMVNSSYRSQNRWSLGPKIRIDKRSNVDGSDQLNIAPGLRFEYRANKHLLFLEAGYLLYFTNLPVFGEQKYSILFTYLGYRYQF